uniref:Putative secreted protein n=1 Tax=Anopheles triannulatus TaxID=58253 RepID=A0A2M4B4J5_9DIPT
MVPCPRSVLALLRPCMLRTVAAWLCGLEQPSLIQYHTNTHTLDGLIEGGDGGRDDDVVSVLLGSAV